MTGSSRRRFGVSIVCTALGACSSGFGGSDSATLVVREFERDATGGEPQPSFTASNGAALHARAGSPAVIVPAAFAPRADARPQDAAFADVLWIRASVVVAGDAACELAIRCGAEERSVLLAATGHRERFEWQPIPMAAVQEPVSLVAAGEGDIWLDQFCWSTARTPPPADASPLVVRQGRLELRAAADAHVFDTEWVLHLLREQYDAVAQLFGRELSGPLVLVALSVEQWPQPESEAFQNGRAIFLREDGLHLPWRGFAHEITHVFEEERRIALPRFWSEGLACAVADEVDARLYEHGAVRARVRWTRLLQRGDELHRPGTSEHNRSLVWATRAAEHEADPRAYEWAGAIVDGLSRLGGEQYFTRLEHALAEPASASAVAAAADDSARAIVFARIFAEAARSRPDRRTDARDDVGELLRWAGIPEDPAAAPAPSSPSSTSPSSSSTGADPAAGAQVDG